MSGSVKLTGTKNCRCGRAKLARDMADHLVESVPISTAAKIEATHSLLPQVLNSLIPVGIPNPLLHNSLNSLSIGRLTP